MSAAGSVFCWAIATWSTLSCFFAFIALLSRCRTMAVLVRSRHQRRASLHASHSLLGGPRQWGRLHSRSAVHKFYVATAVFTPTHKNYQQFQNRGWTSRRLLLDVVHSKERDMDIEGGRVFNSNDVNHQASPDVDGGALRGGMQPDEDAVTKLPVLETAIDPGDVAPSAASGANLSGDELADKGDDCSISHGVKCERKVGAVDEYQSGGRAFHGDLVNNDNDNEALLDAAAATLASALLEESTNTDSKRGVSLKSVPGTDIVEQLDGGGSTDGGSLPDLILEMMRRADDSSRRGTDEEWRGVVDGEGEYVKERAIYSTYSSETMRRAEELSQNIRVALKRARDAIDSATMQASTAAAVAAATVLAGIEYTKIRALTDSRKALKAAAAVSEPVRMIVGQMPEVLEDLLPLPQTTDLPALGGNSKNRERGSGVRGKGLSLSEAWLLAKSGTLLGSSGAVSGGLRTLRKDTDDPAYLGPRGSRGNERGIVARGGVGLDIIKAAAEMDDVVYQIERQNRIEEPGFRVRRAAEPLVPLWQRVRTTLPLLREKDEDENFTPLVNVLEGSTVESNAEVSLLGAGGSEFDDSSDAEACERARAEENWQAGQLGYLVAECDTNQVDNTVMSGELTGVVRLSTDDDAALLADGDVDNYTFSDTIALQSTEKDPSPLSLVVRVEPTAAVGQDEHVGDAAMIVIGNQCEPATAFVDLGADSVVVTEVGTSEGTGELVDVLLRLADAMLLVLEKVVTKSVPQAMSTSITAVQRGRDALLPVSLTARRGHATIGGRRMLGSLAQDEPQVNASSTSALSSNAMLRAGASNGGAAEPLAVFPIAEGRALIHDESIASSSEIDDETMTRPE